MNYKTNFYGAVGLFSTIGKHASGIGEKINSFNKNYTYHYAQQASDKFWATLKGASEHGERFSKWTKTKFQEGETWANEKFAEAKKQEEIKEDWEWNVNALHTFDKLSKSPCWKAKQAVCISLGTATKKAIYCPTFRFGSTY